MLTGLFKFLFGWMGKEKPLPAANLDKALRETAEVEGDENPKMIKLGATDIAESGVDKKGKRGWFNILTGKKVTKDVTGKRI